MRKQIANLVIVTLLITSAIGGMSGSAAAVHDCDSVDALVLGFSFGNINQDKCTNNHIDHAVEEVRDAETAQDKVDIYSAANGQVAQTENYDTLYSNYLQDTESIAWSKAEVAIIEAYLNGSSKAEAKVAAKEAIAEYYATKQINLIHSWNTTTESVNTLDNRADQEGFGGLVHVEKYDLDVNYDGYQSTSVTLVNDSQYGSKAFKFTDTARSHTHMMDVAAGHYRGDNEGWAGYAKDWYVNAPNSNYEQLTFLKPEKYEGLWDEIQTKNSNLQTESDTFVDGIWTDLEDGNINPDDIVSRNTLMFEYGTDSQQNGTYYDTIGALAGMGLDSPNLNNTGQMQITIIESGNSYEGMLFARNAPNGTWEVGTEYDPANIEGPIWFATTSGEMVTVERPFTVDSATSKDGTEQTTVETTDYNYQTSNTTELNEKYDRLLNLTLELQERSEAVGGGGSSDGSSSTNFNFGILTESYFGFPLWLILGVLLSIAYVMTNKDE